MPAALAIAASAISGGAIFGAGSAANEKLKDAAKREAKMPYTKKLDSFRSITGKQVINPYDQVYTDLASMATDRSGQMSNAFNNLSVATKAAEMQIEEADIALANTLDTLMASGAGAGGATALAQAALRSKKKCSSKYRNSRKI